MGWASGSELLDGIITIVFEEVKSSKKRKEIYARLIPLFEDMDCDTIDECVGGDSAFDAVYEELFPEEESDEE